MKIGILGSGVVAQSLAAGFLKHGYKVMLGSRSPEKLNEWKSHYDDNVTLGSFSDAAKEGDLIVLAVKGNKADTVIEMAGVENLSGKTILDTTNPIADAAPVNGVLQYFSNPNKSLMEELQEKYPDLNFVKAFNSVGYSLMVDPDFGGIKPTMFIAGNNENSKKQVREIIEKFGWENEDMGTAEAARAIEPLCILWCIPGFKQNHWADHAFKLLKKEQKAFNVP